MPDNKIITDREEMLEAVKINGWMIKNASDSLKADREVVLEAVKQVGTALEYADDTFKADREVVLEAVKSFGRALGYADASFKTDREVVLEAVKNPFVEGGLEFASDSLKADREVVLVAVKSSVNALQYADDTLKVDREFVLEVVRNRGYALQYVSDSLKADREVVLVAVKSSGNALKYASNTLKADREVVLEAAKNDKDTFLGALQYASKELRHDPELRKIAGKMPIPDSVEGNLYKITLGRITNITKEDNICQGVWDSPFNFCDELQPFGVCHSINDDTVFVIDENGCLDFDGLDESLEYLEELLKKTCKEDELEDAMTIFLIQEAADYEFEESEEHEWITSLGDECYICWDGSEDEALRKFKGALTITVTPYYEQNMDLTALPYGEPLDGEDKAADYHEFCGVRVIR